MSEISEDVKQEKNIEKFPHKLKESLESSNNSHNDEEILFSPNYLLIQSNSNLICKTNPNERNNNRSIFDIMETDVKKKLFSSENNQNSDNKKNSETKSTEPTSIKVKNIISPNKKKRFSIIKLIEKDKKNKKEQSKFAVKKEENEAFPEKKERVDIYGNLICKKNKKNVKISFVDKVTSQPLVNIIQIESFKKYNYNIGIPKEEKIDKSTKCKCCIIF